MCEKGLDDGEPLLYRMYVRFDPTEERRYLLDYDDPYSPVDRICNLIVGALRHPIGLCRVMESEDDFASVKDSALLYVSRGQAEFLERISSVLTENEAKTIADAWSTTEALSRQDTQSDRVSSALVFFYYAWRSHYLDQVCLHLVIALECLFAPHHSGEITHQVAYSVAHFVGGSREERAARYAFVKSLYNKRSAVVHGGRPSEDKLVQLVPIAFDLIAALLMRIASSSKLAQTFTNEPKRRGLLHDLMLDPNGTSTRAGVP